jgi:CBS-domain-containing membrane protein
VEREHELLTTGQVARTDVITCSLTDRVGEIAGPVADSPHGFALVTSTTGVVLGRVRASALDVEFDTPVEQVMDNGPSTVRPDTPACELAQRPHDRNLKTAIITTPEGELIGIARRADLEQHSRLR